MSVLSVNLNYPLDYFDISVRFEMNRGILAIQGESGSGKTTILNLISGIKKPNEGEITLYDEIIFSSKKKRNKKIRDRQIAYVFQQYALFPHMTVRKNIHFTNRVDQKTFNRYLEIFRIEHLLDKYPRDISGGEMQRVAMTRALVTNPKLLLLDEPFSALDENLKQELYGQFLQFKEQSNLPMILITHNRKEAELLADRILEIQTGKIISDISL